MEDSKLPFKELAVGQLDRIKQEVEDYLVKSAVRCNIGHFIIDPEAHDHVVSIGTKILCRQWGLGHRQHGGFIEAFVSNDLRGAYSRADSLNRQALYFYCSLVHNVGYIE